MMQRRWFRKPDEYAALDDVFYVETAKIEDNRDVVTYIRNEALDLLKDENGEESGDFYFAYVYRDQTVNYLVARSSSYIAGKIPAIAPAFMAPGRYLYRFGRRQFVIEHAEDGKMTTYSGIERHEGCIDLTDFSGEGTPPEVPDTLRLQWSLARRDMNTNLILTIVLILTACNCLYQGMRYEKITTRAKELAQKNIEAQSAVHKMPESNLGALPALIGDIAGRMEGKGSISAIKIDGDRLAVSLVFVNEDEARNYIGKNGGVYVEGKVLLGDGGAGPGNTGSHDPERPGKAGR